MVLDGALADAEIKGDDLAGLAGKDQLHDLVLSWRKARDAIGRAFSRGKQRTQNPLLLDQFVVLMT